MIVILTHCRFHPMTGVQKQFSIYQAKANISSSWPVSSYFFQDFHSTLKLCFKKCRQETLLTIMKHFPSQLLIHSKGWPSTKIQWKCLLESITKLTHKCYKPTWPHFIIHLKLRQHVAMQQLTCLDQGSLSQGSFLLYKFSVALQDSTLLTVDFNVTQTNMEKALASFLTTNLGCGKCTKSDYRGARK